MAEPDYKTEPARSTNRDALNAEIEGHLASGTSNEWVERLNEAGMPCGPIYSIDQVFADPQVRHLGIAQSVGGKKNGKNAQALASSASRCRCRGPGRGWWRRRPSSANIPTRCSRSSAFPRARSRRCTRPGRCEVLIQETKHQEPVNV